MKVKRIVLIQGTQRAGDVSWATHLQDPSIKTEVLRAQELLAPIRVGQNNLDLIAFCEHPERFSEHDRVVAEQILIPVLSGVQLTQLTTAFAKEDAHWQKNTVFLGHSYGLLITAFFAGFCTYNQTLELAKTRGLEAAKILAPSLLVKCKTPENQATLLQLCKDLGRKGVSVRNTPNLTVVSDLPENIQTIKEALNEEEIGWTDYTLGSSWHSDHLWPARRIFTERFKRMHLGRTLVRICVPKLGGVRITQSPRVIRNACLQLFTEPFDFWSMLEHLVVRFPHTQVHEIAPHQNHFLTAFWKQAKRGKEKARTPQTQRVLASKNS